VFISFIIFEICVGIFWPSMSLMRSKYIPESSEFCFTYLMMNTFVVDTNIVNVMTNIAAVVLW
jgi:MFS transporter, MFS domain-containing protein family, molybdate-anion transporter